MNRSEAFEKAHGKEMAVVRAGQVQVATTVDEALAIIGAIDGD